MMTKQLRTVAAAALLGLAGATIPMAAHAALNTEALDNAAAPEMADVALGINAVLESVSADADVDVIVAALHAYLTSADYDAEMIKGGLEIALSGEWSDTEREALNRLFSRYFPDDVAAPSGGAAARQTAATGRPAVESLTETVAAPSGGGVALTTQVVEEDQTEPVSDDNKDDPPQFNDPPPVTFSTGTTDYPS
jgi:hypothetical protein